MAQARAAGTPAPGAAGSHDLPVFVLPGPTGAGKPDWALGLAESAPLEIVSVDAALVYRGADVGTARMAGAARGTDRPGPASGRAYRAHRQPADPASAGSLLHNRTAGLAAAARDRQCARRLATALLDSCSPAASRAARAYRPALRCHDGGGFSRGGDRLTPRRRPHRPSSLDARGGLPAAVGAPRRAIRPGGGGATGRCGDAPAGQAAADLDAGRGPRRMDRSGQSAVVESRHMS